MRMHEGVAGWLLMGTALLALRGAAQLNIDEVTAREDARLAQRIAAIHEYAFMPVAPPDSVPAFPGAVGPGARALNMARDSVAAAAWPIKVWKITTTAGTGNGSLRAILEDSLVAAAYNIVIPAVYGTIDCWGAAISPDSGMGNVYIAGQAGPGAGLFVANCNLWMGKNTHDWVMRYIRWSGYPEGGNAIRAVGFERMYFDHLSLRWAAGMSLELGAYVSPATQCTNCPGYDATIAYSLFYDSDAQYGSPICGITGGDPEDNVPMARALWWKNFFMNCSHRVPSMGGDSVYIHNNIQFNTRREHGQALKDYIVDYRGNYNKRGAWTETGDANSGSWSFLSDCASGTNQKIYYGDSRHWRNSMDPTTPPDSAWRGSKRTLAVWTTADGCTEGDTLPIVRKLTSPLPTNLGWAWTMETPTDTWRDNIIDSLGTVFKIDSLGGWTPVTSSGLKVRDSYDSMRLKHFEDSTSSSLGEGLHNDTVTFPTINGGAVIGDADGDGLPTAYEALYPGTLSDSNADDFDNDPDEDGWFNIEEYLNGSDPTVFTNADGSEAGSSSTFGSGRFVYHAPVALTSLYFVGGTIPIRIPHPDSFAPDSSAIRWLSADSTETLIATDKESLADPTYLDSATVDSIADDWGVPLDSIRLRPTP